MTHGFNPTCSRCNKRIVGMYMTDRENRPFCENCLRPDDPRLKMASMVAGKIHNPQPKITDEM